MQPIESSSNLFGGVIPNPEALSPDPEHFTDHLAHSLDRWRQQDYKVAWLEVPIAKSQLIPIAVDSGFGFHHTGGEYLMLTLQLEQDAFIPAYASHYVGAGGVTINDRDELLVVSEKYRGAPKGHPRFKLPGGALHEGEHLEEGVVREVFEETGVHTEFGALVCFRHWHGYRYGKSDIYFVCRLRPLSEEIVIQEEEIAECLWMPIEAYLGDENVSAFNKRIVRSARESPGVVPTEVDGYGEPNRYEFFMPELR